MKIFAVVCLLFALANAEYTIKTSENIAQYRTECVDELHIADSLVEEYKKYQYPNDAITHCYLKCIFNKMGLFDDAGYNSEYIHEQLSGSDSNGEHDESLHAKIESCIDKNEEGSNTCEWAYRGGICFFKNDLKLVQESVAQE